MMFRRCCVALSTVTLGLATAAQAQPDRPNLEGMWSDPPETIVDTFCLFFCTDAGIDHLNALLDDPKNDAHPTMELYAEATRYQRDEYLRPRLTAAALEQVDLDHAENPGYVRYRTEAAIYRGYAVSTYS